MGTLILIYLLFTAWRLLGAIEEDVSALRVENQKLRHEASQRGSWWFHDPSH